MTEPEARTNIVGSCVQFRINYEQIKQLPPCTSVHSDAISAGGHLWRIDCHGFTHGAWPGWEADKGEYISIFLVHTSKSRSVRAQFEVFMIGGNGKPSDIRSRCETFKVRENGDSWGWGQFMKFNDVEKHFLTEGHVTFACTIMVMDDSAIPVPVPPSDIGTHLGRLLDNTDGTDVSFTVDGEKFPAHRAVLAARSPVPWLRLQCHPSRCTTSHLQHSKSCSGSYTRMNCLHKTSPRTLLLRCFRTYLLRLIDMHLTD
ncbi:hypothetical protein ACQ4PT_008609 [Festuca glaucescens]